MSGTDCRPLISFIMTCYNQEPFIREAVEAALAQTYSPLEIIISDDCSSDRTFEIVKEIAAAYHGPHKVILNRNEKNLGLGAHCSLVISMARGEWIVAAAGDDVSLPERVETIWQYIRKNPDVRGIGSDHFLIDAESREINMPEEPRPLRRVSRYSWSQFPWARHCLTGCAAAWHRDTIRQFRKFPPQVVTEDILYTFQALLLGDILSIPEKLVRYRQTPSICRQSVRGESETKRMQSLIQNIQRPYSWYAVNSRVMLRALRTEATRRGMEHSPVYRKQRIWQIQNYRCYQCLKQWDSASVLQRLRALSLAIFLKRGFACWMLKYLFGYKIGFLLDGKK